MIHCLFVFRYGNWIPTYQSVACITLFTVLLTGFCVVGSLTSNINEYKDSDSVSFIL
ncbi:MAG: hypothetical protein WCG25_02575 [bacterium]